MARARRHPHSPYRRRKDRRPESAPATPPTDLEPVSPADDAETLPPGQMAQLIVDARQGAVDREAAGAIAKPLGDLAQAFAMQAEMLKVVHQNQEKLQDAIADDKRSEMMLNSTKALNETFRGVRSVQQGLADRLQAAERTSTRWKITALVAFVLVVAAGVWAIQRVTSRDSGETDDLRRQVADLRAGIVPRYEKMIEEAKGEATRLRTDLDTLDEALSQARIAAETERRRAEGLDVKVNELERAGGVGSAEAERLQAQVEKLEKEVAFYLEKYQAAEENVRRLNEKVIAQLENPEFWKTKDPEDGRERNIIDIAKEKAREARAREEAEKGETAGAQPEEKPETPKAPSTTFIRKKVNELMSDHRSSHTYAFESVGAVGDTQLERVVLTESAPGKGVVKRITAESAAISVSPRGDIVEVNFRDGGVERRQSDGSFAASVPFYKGRYRLTLYVGNSDSWLSARHGFITVQ